MKRKTLLLLWLIVMMLAPRWGFAQDSYFSSRNCNYYSSDDITSSSWSTSWQSKSKTLTAGNYDRFDVNLVSGYKYYFSLCSSDGGSCAFDSYMALYQVNGSYDCWESGATCLVYNDDGCNSASTFTYTANSSATSGWRSLYITGYSSSYSGSYTLRYKREALPTPPSNYLCSSATTLNCGASLSGTTVGTTGTAHGLPSSASTSNYGVWYTFTGTGGDTKITVTPASGYDTEISVVTGSCGSFTWVGSADNGGSGSSDTYTFSTTSGTRYNVYVAHYSSGNTTTGTFTISRECLAPANATCATATRLDCGATLNGTTVGTPGTAHGLPSSASTSNYGVWYTFTGTGTQTTLTSTTTFDHELSVVSGSCGSFTWVGSKDGSTSTETYTFNTTAGTTYYVYVAYYSSSGTTTGSFTISRTCETPTPTTMVCGTNYSGTLGTSGVWNSYSSCGYSEPGEEHIYAYTAPITGSYTFTTSSSGDPDFFLMTANSNTATNVIGECWGSGDKTVTLTGGQTYYFVADNYSSTSTASYTVNVSCPTLTITAWANPTGAGTINGAGNYTYNDQCTLTATPASGYAFDYWIKNGTETIYTNPYTFNVTNADDFQAHFSVSDHTLNASVNPANSGTISANGTTISGATTYNDGTSVTLTANAATGYTFQNWTIDGNTVSGASTTITMDQDHTVVANFTLNQYTVTLNVGTGGTATGGGTYNEGTTANVEAFPDACHTFSHFIDDNNTPIYGFNPAPITVDHDMTITVVFAAITYNVSATASPSAGGTVTGGGTLDCGSSCTLTATPATNYVFDNWTENGTVVSSNASYNFTVNGDRTLLANFHLDAVNVTATAYDDSNNTTGGGTISGTGSFNIGSTCTLVATPASGYHFVNWTENNMEVATTANYSFTVTTARDLVAHFTQDEYTLNLVADPLGGGTVSASPAGPYHYNDVVTVTATPNSGYIFGSWSDGGTAQHTVTITGNTSLTAYFGADQALTTYANPIEGGYVTIAENQVSTLGAVEVGDGSSNKQNNASPYMTGSPYSFQECLYTASEIGISEGYITSISYYVQNVTNATTTDDRIEVYMKNTNRTSFSNSNSDIELVSANDKVFDGTWHLTNTTGWVTIVLDKPFHYTGSTLMIAFNELTPGISDINFKMKNFASSSVYMNRYKYSSSPLDPLSITNLSSKDYDRANVRLGFGTYHYGQSVTLTAHANEGYQFVNWTENSTEVGTHGNATYTVTMDADHTIYANFERLAKRFINDGNWNVAANWSDGAVPDLTEEVAIEAHAVIPSGVIGYADNIRPITHANGSITIQDGGQLIHNNASNNMVTVTVENTIASYDDGGDNIHNKGYEIVSFPVDNLTAGSNAVTGVFTGSQHPFDFYSFYASEDPLEWLHQTADSTLSLMKGYIYASQDGTTIRVTGPVMSSANNVNGTAVNFLNADAPRFNGWALLGNPFVCNAYVSLGTNNGAGAEANFYKLNHTSGYDEFVPFSSGDAVTPMGGVMFRVYDDDYIVYSRTAPGRGTGILNMDVNKVSVRGAETLDRARVRFGEGRNLEKFQFDTRHTKIYIPEGDQDFSVYYADGAGTIPVNFKAQDNGRYTLDFSTEDVGFNYLHLIDNMNGNDVDLLQTPYYAFDAKSTDFASRFTLVFATGNDNDDTFAFFNNGVWIINNDGNAELQVVDVLGHILSSETISGSCSKAINAAPGVYMLRLINGDKAKVQKIVVKR